VAPVTGPAPPPTAAPAITTPAPWVPPTTGTQEFLVETATEAQIRDNVTNDLTVFRFALNKHVLVLDFASLSEQGMMLNRLGAFAEKAKVPHDRVLDDAELDHVIRREGDTPDTFYYGHDYSADTMARFFALADRDHITLNPQEEVLRRLLRQEGLLVAGATGALISIPRVGADARVDMAARTTILHHELSHGEYFTDPAYRAHTHAFWTNSLTEAERQAVARYLTKESYDPSLQDLIENEAQAYLIFTNNPTFFVPSMIGMTQVRRDRLQANFLRDVPTAWMRDHRPSVARNAR
jgi:hypothetical protein